MLETTVQVFRRELISTHCVGAAWPEFIGRAEIGESIVMETERFSAANGPVAIAGVKAGDPVAVHIEAIEMIGPFFAPNGGPIIGGREVQLRLRDGVFIRPSHFSLRAGLPRARRSFASVPASFAVSLGTGGDSGAVARRVEANGMARNKSRGANLCGRSFEES